VGAGVFAGQIVRVVGGDQRDAGLLAKAEQVRQELLVEIEAVVLDLDEEIVLAEDVLVLVGETAAVVVALLNEGFVDLTAQAGGEANQALAVLLDL
jgi:hypothetical protein